MDTDVSSVASALGELTHTELRALINATNDVPEAAPGLLAWIEIACVWELNRRRGTACELQPLGAMIPPEEEAASVSTATRMRSTFEQENRALELLSLLDAILELLPGGHEH